MTKIFTKNKTLLILCFLGAIQATAQFTNVSAAAGITMTHDGESITEFMDVGSGVAWLDYNQDGNQDLYMTMRDSANYLYKNNGDGTFTDVAGTMGVQDTTGDGAGVAVADFNNDGWPDIYLANGNEDVLLRNNGGTSFTDITSGTGLSATGSRRGTSASWGDYDDDGYLDLYVSHHRPVGTGGYPLTEVQDFLFHNNGGLNFTDKSSLLGISDLQGHGFIGGWTDYDNDGDSDLILINDCLQNGAGAVTEETKVFRNDGGTNGLTDWSFTEVGHSIGIVDPQDPTINDCRNGMGIAVGDFNRDGWMDFYYTNVGHVVLFKNDGDGTFTNISNSAGVETQAAHYFSWGASFVDYDLDGHQDIITAIGSLDVPAAMNQQPNMLFKNNGDSTFTDVAADLGINDSNKTRHIVYSDYDNDGDPDFLVFNYGETPMLMKNEIVTTNHYLIVDLEGNGTDSNKDGIGAKLKATMPDASIQYFETRSGSNLGGGDAVEAYFGLGDNATVTELEITWPSGIVQVLDNITADQKLAVAEDSGLPVEFSSFDAAQIKESVVLDWATFSESNNDYFSIQRSANGGTFEEIGRITGGGTTTAFSTYEFIDDSPLKGNNYYRLRQTDFDGRASFSEIRNVVFESTSIEIIIAPNPVHDHNFTLSYSGGKSDASFAIYDIFGKQIQNGIIQNNASKEISTTGFSNGMYVIRVLGDNVGYTEKLLINQ